MFTCGYRIRHTENLSCFYKREADKFQRSLDPSATILNGLLEHEIEGLRGLCAREARELHYPEYVLGCQARVWTWSSLGTAETECWGCGGRLIWEIHYATPERM
jgi:hypothetical protein